MRVNQTISSDHPSLPGHFPGDPVIPAALLVEAAQQVVLEHANIERLCGFSKLKLRALIKPDIEFEIAFEETKTGYFKVSLSQLDVVCVTLILSSSSLAFIQQ